MGRRDDPHVDLHRVVAAERLDRPFLQHPQQLGLRRLRQLRDLVEKQRAAVRRLEPAVAAGGGVGERAALVTEQLGFDQGVRERGAVDRHERLRPALAPLVDRARDQLLAGSALAA